jgi:drug/metabolite transporter (DMT)-like permease
MYNQKQTFKPSKTLIGIVLMVIHAAALSAIYVIAKRLGKTISGDQIAFLYKAGGLVCTIPLMFKGNIVNNLKTSKIKLHILRSIFSLSAAICFYRGLLEIPAVDAAAITYLEPIFALVVGVIYFKEHITSTKILLMILCISGTLFIVQPGFKSFNNSYMYLLGTLIFWSMNNLTMKILGKTERTTTTVFYMGLFTTIFGLPLALSHSWETFDWTYTKYLVVMTLCHITHTICFFRAVKLSDISIVMPFDYTRLFFTGILGYIFLKEYPNKYSAIGYCLIAMGGIMLILYETKKRGWSRESEEKFIKSKEKTSEIS